MRDPFLGHWKSLDLKLKGRIGFSIKALALMKAISPQANQMVLDSSKQNWPQGMTPCQYFYPHSLSPALPAGFLARNHVGKMGEAQSKPGSIVAFCSLGLCPDSYLTVPCHWEIKARRGPGLYSGQGL